MNFQSIENNEKRFKRKKLKFIKENTRKSIYLNKKLLQVNIVKIM